MSIDAMKQALEALELLARYENPATKIQIRKPRDGGSIVTMYPHKVASEAATALRAAIEQAQEPVAWRITDGEGDYEYCTDLPEDWSIQWSARYGRKYEPLYTAPTPRQWQGLTDEEVSEILDREIGFNSCFGPETDFARAIEAKLREKNT